MYYTDRGWREMKKTEWKFDLKMIWGQTGTKPVYGVVISSLGPSAPLDQQQAITVWDS